MSSLDYFEGEFGEWASQLRPADELLQVLVVGHVSSNALFDDLRVLRLRGLLVLRMVGGRDMVGLQSLPDSS